jgi:RHS repeat-associated protein
MKTASSAINSWGSSAATGFGDGSNDSSHPKAFVNILIFDKDYNLLDFAYQQVTSGTPSLVKASYTVKQPGYAYLYISNENPSVVDVYFDDVKMSLKATQVIQSTEYYPFGMQTQNSWTRPGASNNYLYNESSELNTTSGLYDLPYRNYDPSLGRFFQIDPMAAEDHSVSPYVFGRNNPISNTDPSGLMVDYAHSTSNPEYVLYLQQQDAARAAAVSNNNFIDPTETGGPIGGGNYYQSFSDANAFAAGTMSLSDYVGNYGTEIYNASSPGKATAGQIINGVKGGVNGLSGFWIDREQQFELDGGGFGVKALRSVYVSLQRGSTQNHSFSAWGWAPFDYEDGKYSARVSAKYSMDVKLSVYQVPVYARDLKLTGYKWRAQISATSFVTFAGAGIVLANANVSLIADGVKVSTQTLSIQGDALIRGGGQYSYIGQATFDLPSTYNLRIEINGGWIIEYDRSNRAVPSYDPILAFPLQINGVMNVNR